MEKGHLADTGITRRMILKWILREIGWKCWLRNRFKGMFPLSWWWIFGLRNTENFLNNWTSITLRMCVPEVTKRQGFCFQNSPTACQWNSSLLHYWQKMNAETYHKSNTWPVTNFKFLLYKSECYKAVWTSLFKSIFCLHTPKNSTFYHVQDFH
jgi:hypothetical protein